MERTALMKKLFPMLLLLAGVLMPALVGCNKYASAPPAGNEKNDPKNWKLKKMGNTSSQPGPRSPGK
jgi:hypothetical protein